MEKANDRLHAGCFLVKARSEPETLKVRIVHAGSSSFFFASEFADDASPGSLHGYGAGGLNRGKHGDPEALSLPCRRLGVEAGRFRAFRLLQIFRDSELRNLVKIEPRRGGRCFPHRKLPLAVLGPPSRSLHER